MVFRSFRINCVLRIIALSATIGLFFWLLSRTRQYAAMFIVGLIILYEIYALIVYVDRTNRELARFFESIKYEDFSQSFSTAKKGGSFAPLLRALSEVTDAFRKTRAEKEEHYHYLQTVVQHVGVGLIVFQPDGDVELINNAAKKLLRVPYLKNIRSLESMNKKLVTTLLSLKPRDRALVKIEGEEEILQLMLYATEFRLGGRVFTLVSLQNIRSEIESTEIEAWQKLIRVLTHEIMNSITPISSLASTINGLIREMGMSLSGADKADSEQIEDIIRALQTIQKRSDGLLHFVDAYRNLTLLPAPKFQIFALRELLARAAKIMEANIKNKNIRFELTIEPETLELIADPELIEQVLINLQLNALQAVEGQPEAGIRLSARLDSRGRVLVQVSDNGPGIPEENLEKIFIPFFSTKEGGSGIGLSLSRQIMRLHNGTISVSSRPGEETVFTLRF
jgi:two-component system nitrogen regulation sensor histidine kinase NtrY